MAAMSTALYERTASNTARLDLLEPRVERLEGFVLRVVFAALLGSASGGGLVVGLIKLLT